MRRLLLRLVLLVLAAICALACGGASDRGLALDANGGSKRVLPRVWTFAVGVSSYSESSLDLKFAARDAEEVDRFFASPAGSAVPPSRRVLLTDARATRAEILGSFEKLTRLLSPDDLLVVFLAMHGVVTDRGNLYFVAHDSSPTNIRGTGLANADVEQAVRDADVKHVLFLADTCHSGGVGLSGRRGMAADETNRLLATLAQAKPGTAILTASRGAELSQEDARWGGGHGVFTHFVLQGMSGAADEDHDQLVTVSELFDFVYGRVKEATAGAQHPELKGRFENGMPVSMKESAPPARPDKPVAPPAASAPTVTPPPASSPARPPEPVTLLVLDLPPAERGALETAVARGSVAAVAYASGSLKVLASCRVRGRYEFNSRGTGSTGYSASTVDDLRRHFPLSGTRFLPALRANSSVTANLAYGGEFVAREYLAERSTLVGTCTGATHVLRALKVGAFEVRSADELLDSAGDMKVCSNDLQQQCRIALEATLVPLR